MLWPLVFRKRHKKKSLQSAWLQAFSVAEGKGFEPLVRYEPDNWFRVSPVMTTSITLRVYFNLLLTQKIFGEKSRREHWKIFDFWFWKPFNIKDSRRTKRPSRRKISSAAPSTTRTTLRVCDSAFLPKTFGKNWRKEQQNIQFSNRRKPLILRAF